MKKLPVLLLVLLFVSPLPFLEAGKKDKEVAAEAEDEDSKRNTTVFEVEASLSGAHDAAVLALSKIGCKIKKDQADYIQGKRPNKVGLAVGSGGEKLFVWIKELDADRVEITVKTKKTMVGLVGQKLWNEEIAEDIRASLL